MGHVAFQQLVDDLPAGVTDFLLLGAAPARGLPLERDLFRRVVALAGAFALFKGGVGRDQATFMEDLAWPWQQLTVYGTSHTNQPLSPPHPATLPTLEALTRENIKVRPE